MKTLDNINLDKPSGNYETILTPTDQLSAGVKAILEIFEEQGVPKYKVDNIAKLFGSVIKVAGVEQGAVEFTSDPQSQLDIIESDIATLDADKATSESVALNTDAIADLALNKQDKLSQIDLDNIAMLNQLPDKLDAKQDKLSAQQIANIDDVPNKASKSFLKPTGSQYNITLAYGTPFTNTKSVPVLVNAPFSVRGETLGYYTITVNGFSKSILAPAVGNDMRGSINEIVYPNQTLDVSSSANINILGAKAIDLTV